MANDFDVTFGGAHAVGGTSFERDVQLVVVHDGRRGVKGNPGRKGDQGDPGRSIRVLGPWTPNTSYCPGDAVTGRSRLMPGITSMYLQRSSKPCSIATLEPWADPARWDEVNSHSWGNTFGGIWEVYQINHGFTRVGQPVAYSWQANRYTLASAASEDELGIAIVRAVVDKDRVLLQSTGELPNIDPAVIYPDGDGWQDGRLYYVSTARGRLEAAPPIDANAFTNPILIATGNNAQTGGKNGVALPWRPVVGAKEYIPVGQSKFRFTATAGQQSFTGPDLDNVLLRYIVGDNTDVFVNGLNIREDRYVATDGFEITFNTPLQAGDHVEVWTPDRPLDILVKSTTLKLDNIEAQFDGVKTTFKLSYGDLPIVFQDASSVMIWLDATGQEPLIDYVLTDVDGDTAVAFKDAPERGTRFWGLALSPAGQSGLPGGGATGAVLMKMSSADGDIGWVTEIDGGTW